MKHARRIQDSDVEIEGFWAAIAFLVVMAVVFGMALYSIVSE